MYKIKTYFYVSKFWLTKLFWHKSDFDSKILCLKIGTTNLQSSKKEKGSTFTEYYSNKICWCNICCKLTFLLAPLLFMFHKSIWYTWERDDLTNDKS